MLLSLGWRTGGYISASGSLLRICRCESAPVVRLLLNEQRYSFACETNTRPADCLFASCTRSNQLSRFTIDENIHRHNYASIQKFRNSYATEEFIRIFNCQRKTKRTAFKLNASRTCSSSTSDVIAPGSMRCAG